MNAFDVLIVLLVVVAAIGGYRLGFVTRVTSWVGLALGLFIAVRLLPPVLEALRDRPTDLRLAAAIALVFGCAFAGQALGMVIGDKLRPAARNGQVTRADGVFGTIAGVFGVLVLVWLLLPLLADTPGWVATQARQSAIAQTIDARLPSSPDSIQALRSLMGEDNFPQVFEALSPAPDVGPPPPSAGIDTETTARVARSVVKVEGIACSQIQDGTGFAVAADEVVTNAHVVAGERSTDLVRDDGSRVRATVVAFDPDRDLAVLRAPGLARPPLQLAESRDGGTGGVFGHPGGGALRVAPFEVNRRIVAVGRDIYDEAATRRDVLELRAALRPGDSGSALVDANGKVVGVAFAIAPDRSDVAYALTTSELTPVLEGDLSTAVDTGPCTGAA